MPCIMIYLVCMFIYLVSKIIYYKIFFCRCSRPIVSFLLFQTDYLNFKLLSFFQQMLDCISFCFWADRKKPCVKKPLWFRMSQIGIGFGGSVLSVNVHTLYHTWSTMFV